MKNVKLKDWESKRKQIKMPICPYCLKNDNVVPINDVAFGCHSCGEEFRPRDKA